jgi:hypothetical protein
MFNIFEELTWPQFSQLPNVAKLSLNEQVIQYNQYLFELSEARISWLEYQNKGPQSNIIGALAQEESYINIDYQVDYYNILQEDGSLIYVTR